MSTENLKSDERIVQITFKVWNRYTQVVHNPKILPVNLQTRQFSLTAEFNNFIQNLNAIRAPFLSPYLGLSLRRTGSASI